MPQQEIDQVEVIALDAFRSGGKTVRKEDPFHCTTGTAKQLVATGKARWPTDEDRAEPTASQPEGDPEKLDAKRAETQAAGDAETETEEAPAKAEAAKATKSTKASK